ncbi:gamma-glutamyl-gamma-aminobutyrate hydrolase family protein [Streptomyces sp. M19]
MAEERHIPVFGVCLGLQAIVEYLGGRLEVLDRPHHGKPSTMTVLGDGGTLLAGLPERVRVGRYHSLYADRAALPADLRVTAETADGVAMAVEHRTRPLAGVQFHPESLMTQFDDHGLAVIGNVVAGSPAPRGPPACDRPAGAEADEEPGRVRKSQEERPFDDGGNSYRRPAALDGARRTRRREPARVHRDAALLPHRGRQPPAAPRRRAPGRVLGRRRRPGRPDRADDREAYRRFGGPVKRRSGTKLDQWDLPAPPATALSPSGAAAEAGRIGPGLYVGGPKTARLVRALDRLFGDLAIRLGAEEYTVPAMVPWSTLEKADYTHNFPQHVTATSVVRPDLDALDRFSAAEDHRAREAELEIAPVVLAPAVCVSLFERFGGARLTEPLTLTATGRCSRYEGQSDTSPTRLWSFSMREIVFLGDRPAARAFREAAIEEMVRLSTELALPCRVAPAGDPFFTKERPELANFQAAMDVKYELVGRMAHDGKAVAVSSLNYHNQHFGKGFEIDFGDRPAFSVCLGFGLERWAEWLSATWTTPRPPGPRSCASGAEQPRRARTARSLLDLRPVVEERGPRLGVATADDPDAVPAGPGEERLLRDMLPARRREFTAGGARPAARWSARACRARRSSSRAVGRACRPAVSARSPTAGHRRRPRRAPAVLPGPGRRPGTAPLPAEAAHLVLSADERIRLDAAAADAADAERLLLAAFSAKEAAFKAFSALLAPGRRPRRCWCRHPARARRLSSPATAPARPRTGRRGPPRGRRVLTWTAVPCEE